MLLSPRADAPGARRISSISLYRFLKRATLARRCSGGAAVSSLNDAKCAIDAAVQSGGARSFTATVIVDIAPCSGLRWSLCPQVCARRTHAECVVGMKSLTFQHTKSARCGGHILVEFERVIAWGCWLVRLFGGARLAGEKAKSAHGSDPLIAPIRPAEATPNHTAIDISGMNNEPRWQTRR
jgi:hypothetical protein